MATSSGWHYSSWGGPWGTARLAGLMERTAVSVPNNTSSVRNRYWVESGGTSFNYNAYHDEWFDGYRAAEYWTRRILPTSGSVLICDYTRTITHNANGSRVVGSGMIFDIPELPYRQTLDIALTLDVIPRASTPTLSGGGSFTTGVAKTILMNRASGSGFTHHVSYTVGGLSGVIATAATDSVSWTPPNATLATGHLATAFTTSASTTITITVQTKSGTTNVGSAKSVGFTLNAGDNVIPTVGAVSWTEQNTLIASAIGAFVQGRSLIKGVVTATGVLGSTIVDKKLIVSGVELNDGSIIDIQNSGTITASGKAVDSRGRTGTRSQNITVLPYTAPSIGSGGVSIERSNSSNVATADGTFLRIQLHAVAVSLKPVSTEKNGLTIGIRTKNSTGAWVARTPIPPPGSGLVYNSVFQLSAGTPGFPLTESIEVEITLKDNVTTEGSVYIITIPTAVVTLDLYGPNVGIGKYHERGTLDVGGDAYATNFRADEASYAKNFHADEKSYAQSFHALDGGAVTEYKDSDIGTPYGRMGTSFSGTTAQRLALATAGKAVNGIFFHDTGDGRTYQRRGGGWAWIFPEVTKASTGGNQSVTSQVALSGMSQAVVLSITQSLKFNVRFRVYGTAVALVEITLWDGSTKIASWTKTANSGGAGTPNEHTLEIVRSIAAGSHTFSVRAQCVVGTSVTSAPDASLSPNQLSISPL